MVVVPQAIAMETLVKVEEMEAREQGMREDFARACPSTKPTRNGDGRKSRVMHEASEEVTHTRKLGIVHQHDTLL